jgi:3-methyladenine DNA glycosylase AlkD
MRQDDADRLLELLRGRSSQSTADWWNRYLKGAIEFIGVPMDGIRRSVRTWIEVVPETEREAAALALLEHPVAEMKLAGILVLQEHLLPSGADSKTLLSDLATRFDAGDIADWNTTDWLCVRVLGPLVARDGMTTARLIASWVDAPTLWRRRAGVVAFVDVVTNADDELRRLVLDACSTLVRDDARFAQTAVGWVMRSISAADPRAAADFLRANAERMSREAVRMAAARLSDAERTSLGITGKRRRR